MNFSLALMGKDLTYAIAEGALYAVPLSTAEAALRSFQRAHDQGHGARDMSAVIEPLRVVG